MGGVSGKQHRRVDQQVPPGASWPGRGEDGGEPSWQAGRVVSSGRVNELKGVL